MQKAHFLMFFSYCVTTMRSYGVNVNVLTKPYFLVFTLFKVGTFELSRSSPEMVFQVVLKEFPEVLST